MSVNAPCCPQHGAPGAPDSSATAYSSRTAARCEEYPCCLECTWRALFSDARLWSRAPRFRRGGSAQFARRRPHRSQLKSGVRSAVVDASSTAAPAPSPLQYRTWSWKVRYLSWLRLRRSAPYSRNAFWTPKAAFIGRRLAPALPRLPGIIIKNRLKQPILVVDALPRAWSRDARSVRRAETLSLGHVSASGRVSTSWSHQQDRASMAAGRAIRRCGART